jgi:hypothetical protein
MLLKVIDHLSAARVGNPESNVRAIQSIAFQQGIQCAFYQRACQVANLVCQNDSQFVVFVFEADLVYVFRSNARFAIENRRLDAGLPGIVRNQERRRAVRANCISNHRIHGVVDEIAGRTNLYRQHQRPPLRVGAYEVAGVLQGWQRSRATQADHHRAMYIAAKPHVSDQTASQVGAYVSGRRAYYKEIDIRHLALSPLQARRYRSAAGFHGTAQVALVQFAGCFLADLARRNVKVPKIDIAIAEDLKDSWACIAGHLEGLVLAEAARRVRQADRFDLNGSQEMLPP